MLDAERKFDYSSIPLEMKALKRWVGFILKPRSNGKIDKIPVDPKSGKAINCHKNEHHRSFGNALKLYESEGVCDGLGFVLIAKDKIICIDLDNAKGNPTRTTYAKQIKSRLGTYCEISQSGEGLHFFAKGRLPMSWNNSQINGTEAYGDNRFIAMTGRLVRNCTNQLSDVSSDDLKWLIETFAPNKRELINRNVSNKKNGDSHSESEIQQALASISPHDYDTWLKVGMALRSSGLTNAKELWYMWSSESDKFDQENQDKTWNSFKKNSDEGHISLGTLFYLAKANQHKEFPNAEYVSKYNKEYFTCLYGDKFRVAKEIADPEHGKTKVQMLTKPDFLALNQANANAAEWLKHPMHRHYEGICYCPEPPVPTGYYNQWTGFSVKSIAGDWSLLREHLLKVVCDGNDENFNYLLRWLAFSVQRPGTPPGVSVVLRGNKGSGKTTVGEVMKKLFGRHGLAITNPYHLTGNFNKHLSECSFLLAEEAFFAGDKKSESSLKSLITDRYFMVEPKGVDAFQARNNLHIMMISNNEWVVPASKDERRYLVLDVNDSRRNDHSYFEKLQKQLANGGYEAFLYDLQNLDLSSFNVRQAPKTSGLTRQKLESLNVYESWLYEAISTATFPTIGAWPSQVEKERLRRSFEEYCKTHGRTHNLRGSAQKVGKILREVFGHDLSESRPNVRGKRTHCWILPNLPEARKQFREWLEQ